MIWHRLIENSLWGFSELLRDGLPVRHRSVTPEVFEVVEFAAFAGEDMQDDVAIVLQNPSFRLATFDTDARAAASFFHQLLDFLGDGSHLTATRGGGDDEEVYNRRDRSHVENKCVLALEVGAGLRRQAGEFTAGLLTFG